MPTCFICWRGSSSSLPEFTDQVADRQHELEAVGHLVVLQRHEKSVQHDADGDHEVGKRVRHKGVHGLLYPPPQWAAIPDEVLAGQVAQERGAFPIGLLQF